MSQVILDALAKLDPGNDNHWTSEGLPRIDTVKLMAGDQSLTREAITAAAPFFSRSNPKNEAPSTSAGELPAATEETQGNTNIQPGQAEAKDYDALIAEATEELDEIRIYLEKGQAEYARRRAALDRLINEKAALEPKTSHDENIQLYLKRQQAELEERARRNKVLKDSGVTLQDIQSLLPEVSPLDKAMASKKR